MLTSNRILSWPMIAAVLLGVVLCASIVAAQEPLQFNVPYRCADGTEYIVHRCEPGRKGEVCFYSIGKNGKVETEVYNIRSQMDGWLKVCKIQSASSGKQSAVPSQPGQALNPPYLGEMPSVERVMQAMTVSDPRETALRQMGAFYQLIEIIKTLSGRREFRGFTPDEARIIGAYQVAQYNVGQAADKSFPGPVAGAAKFSDQTPYRYGRWDPRFGMEGIQTFKTFLSPTLKAEFDKIVGGDNMRRQARQDADPIRVKPPAADNGQPAVQSGVDGLVKALSDLINQPVTPQPSQLPGAEGSAADVQASTAEYKKGRALLEAKDYARAIEHLKKSNSIVPSSAAYMDMGIAYSQLKQYPEAIEAYKQVVRMVPNNAEVHLRLATAYQGQGSELALGPSHSKDLKPFENAEAEAREALRLKPGDHDAYFMLGNATFVQRRYPEALTAFQQAIRLKADDQASLYLLSLSYVKLGKKDEAMQVYQKLAALDKDYAQKLLTEINKPVAANPPVASTAPGTAGFYINEGHKYFKAKDGAKALEAYQQAVRLKPDDPEGHFWVGETYLKLDQPEKAVAAFHESLRFRPNDARTLGELGSAYDNLRQYPEAAAAFQQAIRLEPNEWVNYSMLGLIYDNSLQFEKAAAAYKELVRLKPDDKDAIKDLGEAYAILGKKAEAMQVYNTLLKLDKDAAKSFLDEINGPGGAVYVLVRKAQVELLGGNKETVLEYLRYALRLKPVDPDAILEIGYVFGYAGQNDEALELYRRVIAMNPKPEKLAEAHSSIGSTYNDMKEYAKALPELKESQRIKTDYYTSKKLGDAYFGLKDYPNALAAFQDSVRLKPDYADGHFWIGKSCVVMKQLDKALAAFQEYVRLEPKDSKGFYELGHTYFLLRRLPEAVSALEKAISIYPKNAEAHLGLGMSYLAIGKRDAALQEYNTLQTLDKAKAQELYNAINRPGTGPPSERRGPGPSKPPGGGQTPRPPGGE